MAASEDQSLRPCKDIITSVTHRVLPLARRGYESQCCKWSEFSPLINAISLGAGWSIYLSHRAEAALHSVLDLSNPSKSWTEHWSKFRNLALRHQATNSLSELQLNGVDYGFSCWYPQMFKGTHYHKIAFWSLRRLQSLRDFNTNSGHSHYLPVEDSSETLPALRPQAVDSLQSLVIPWFLALIVSDCLTMF